MIALTEVLPRVHTTYMWWAYLGDKCRLEVYIFTDGKAAYFHVPDKNQKSGKPRGLVPSTKAQLVEHLRTSHNHDLVPDVELMCCLPQCRGVPEMAKDTIRDMRGAGVPMKHIYEAIKVAPTLPRIATTCMWWRSGAYHTHVVEL